MRWWERVRWPGSKTVRPILWRSTTRGSRGSPAIRPVSSKGIKARKVGSLPRFLRGLFLAAKESNRLTVEAVVHQSYEHALQALTINPFVPSLETAKRFLDNMVKDEKLELH